MSIIRIARNAVHARLLDTPKDAMLEVHRVLSYTVAGSDHMASFQSGSWNGKSSFFSYDKAEFPAGFTRLVAHALQKIGHTVQILQRPLPAPLGPEFPEVDAFGYTPRYDYQPAAVDQLIRHGNVTTQVATGGGKSRIARMAYRRIGRPTLFVTTRGILMHQMKAAVEGMGEEVAVLGDSEWGIPYTKPDGSKGRRITRFVVAMVQTLAQRLEVKTLSGEYAAWKDRTTRAIDKKTSALRAKMVKEKAHPLKIGEAVNALFKSLKAALPSDTDINAELEAKVAEHERKRKATIAVLERFELVIAEEAHEVSGDGFFRVMETCRNAHYRMALTATPFMKDDEAANMRLLASCGPIATRITEELLISRGILARPYFKFLKLAEAPEKLYRSTPWARAYELGVVNAANRNGEIVRELLRAKKYGLTAMVLVQHKAHGQLLQDLLRASGFNVVFIFGENDQAERQAALHALGRGELDVLIGSTILDVGVDVPAVGVIVLAGGGKAEVALRQRIGRGLREKKAGPNVAFIIDVYDEWNSTLKEHSGQRQAIIKATPGFAENIVRDFDFEALGFKETA